MLEAAVELLGTEGLRALTHARIDAQAGVPKGSTSNYFRTRAQLLIGVSDWIGERDLASAEDIATAPHTPADLVEGLAIGIEMLTGPHRIVTAARLTLFMEIVNATNRENFRPSSPGVNLVTRRVFEPAETTFPLLPVAGILLEF